MGKRSLSAILTICIISAFMPQIYAENTSVELNSTNTITTTELFMQYPTYLSNTTMDEGFRSGQEACYAVLDSYTETDTAVSVAMTALSKGISVKVRDELASFGLTDSTYETYAKDAAKELLEQALGDEHTIGKSAKNVSKAYKHFKTAYKDINTLGQAEVLEELRTIASENDISMTTEEVDEMVKELFESKDLKKGLDNLDAAMDMWKYVTEMTELYAIEASTIDFLMDELDKSGQSESDLYLGLSLLKRDIHKNPAAYVLKRYVTEKAISFLSKNMEKLIYGVTGASTITVAAVQAFAKLFADYVYVDAKADKLTQAIMHMSYISSIETCLSQYRLKFLQGKGTADDIDNYEALYGACNNAYVSALDACYNCAKLDDKFSLGGDCKIWADEIENYFTYDKYLEWCKAAVMHDLQAETLDSKTGESTITDALNEETILKNLERVYRLYPPNEGEIWNGKYDGVRGSVGFAAKVFNHIFDSNLYTKVDSKYKFVLTNESNVRLIGRLEEGSVTADALKTMFTDARIGDVIFTSGKDDSCHAMILVGFTDNGITVYDCESKFYDKDSHPYALKKYEFTYAAMAESFNSHGDYKDVAGISVYRAVKKVNAENSGKSIADEEYDDSADFVIEGSTLKEYIGTKTEVHIPYGVSSIVEECFKDNNTIEKVYMPNTVEYMGDDCFFNCENLQYIILSNQITYIRDYTFSACHSLSYISIPDSVERIGERAFNGCSALAHITIPKSVKEIDRMAFADSNLENIQLPDTVTRIEEGTFGLCTNLKNVILPDSLKYIGSRTFSECTSLEYIDIPSSVEDIDDHAFEQCRKLKSIVLPYSSTGISMYTFYGCQNLRQITIPDSYTAIGYGAFQNCVNLETIKIPNNMKYIRENAFEGCTNLKEINLPLGIAEIEGHTFKNCTSLPNISLPNSITIIGEQAFYNCNNLKEIDLPSNMTRIENYAFSSCNNLTNISLPDNIKSIGNYSFRDCISLSNIKIPNSVTEIGYGAFQGCSSLKDLILSENITSIDFDTFSHCESLKNIVIPNGVVSIGRNAFLLCDNLTSIFLPISVTIIEDSAFEPYNWYFMQPKDIYYVGTKEQWDQITINNTKNYLNKTTIHYLAESLPEPDPSAETQYSITLSDSDIELMQDDTHTLTATVTPENSVTWISSDYGVASVDQKGVVTPVRAGTATITARVDSSDAKATCTVTVLPPPEITEFYIDKGENGYTAYISTADVPASAAVWVASYNTENRLIGIQKMEGNKEEQAEFDTPNAANFKAFVWNMTTLKPLANSQEAILY